MSGEFTNDLKRQTVRDWISDPMLLVYFVLETKLHEIFRHKGS